MSSQDTDLHTCRRCGRPVGNTRDFKLFEGMHYVCFHYEFEHDDTDVDAECNSGGCPSRRVGLDQALATWTDWDLAAFALGRAVGLYETAPEFHRLKGDFWTDNSLGSGLHEALGHLAESGILERRDEPDIQFRWRGRNQ